MCTDTCILITNDDYCRFTPHKQFDLSNYTELVEKANVAMESLTGVCDLCEDYDTEDYEFDQIIADKKFKRLYASIIYYNWILVYGSFQSRKEGLTRSMGDVQRDYETADNRQAEQMASSYQERFVKDYEQSFLSWFFMHEQGKACIDKTCQSCGCLQTDCYCAGGFIASYSYQNVEPNNLRAGQQYDPQTGRYHDRVDYGFDEDYSVIK